MAAGMWLELVQILKNALGSADGLFCDNAHFLPWSAAKDFLVYLRQQPFFHGQERIHDRQ